MPRSERCRNEKNWQEWERDIKMDIKTKQRLFTILYVILIIVVVCTCAFLVNYLTGQGGECLRDPIQFFSNKTGQMCYCNDGAGWLNPIENNDYFVIKK